MKGAETHFDVAIVGGGPAGSTAGTLLKKYLPESSVIVLEREKFPRDHVGESLLPLTSSILDEMGVWDEIERADFPIKLGATYKWGKDQELWDFNFVPAEEFEERPRPSPYSGQRTATAFQVDRAIYDDILLRHCEKSGCDVRQETRVVKTLLEGRRIAGLQLDDGTVITADYYCDASGHSGILRRALGIEEQINTSLKNIAIWDYWQNADWAVKIGIGGTRIQVLSLGFGWIWFIPLGPTRTSIGLVVPAHYYKDCGKSPEELYRWALSQEAKLKPLLKNANSEGLLSTTKDWSFVAERTCGENWFLIGESAGFADPILSAGVTMAHMAGREFAYTAADLIRRNHKPQWLKSEFDRRQKTRINQHIRFADYWYAGNGCFSDLKEFSESIAKDAGIQLGPDEAWRWIAQGGFVDEDLIAGTSFFSLRAVESIGEFISGAKHSSPLEKYNIFDLDLKGAQSFTRALYQFGQITEKPGYSRNGRILPLEGTYKVMLDILKQNRRITDIDTTLKFLSRKHRNEAWFKPLERYAFQALEALVNDGWVRASFDPKMPLLSEIPKETAAFRPNSDPAIASI